MNSYRLDPYTVFTPELSHIQDKWINWIQKVDLSDLRHQLNAFTNPYRQAYLGHYFESLLEFWLREDPSIELIAHNRQIHKDDRTIGEIDFVFHDQDTREYIHFESSVKFYLSAKGTSDWSSWIGPNVNDDLNQKLTKVGSKQIPLAQSHSHLFQIPARHELRSYLFMKGMFFHSVDRGKTLPMNANPNALTGFWCHYKDLETVLNREMYWKVLNKHDWLGLNIYRPETKGIFRSIEMIKKLRSTPDEAFLLASLRKQDGVYIENDRIFVVRDDWPTKQQRDVSSSQS